MMATAINQVSKIRGKSKRELVKDYQSSSNYLSMFPKTPVNIVKTEKITRVASMPDNGRDSQQKRSIQKSLSQINNNQLDLLRARRITKNMTNEHIMDHNIPTYTEKRAI